VPYGEDSAVLIGLRGICFMDMCLMAHIPRGVYLMGRVSHGHAPHGLASHRQDCAESRYQ
jgi:hypothetical protein